MEPPKVWEAPSAGGPVDAVIRPPGSKSMTARALVLGAISQSATTLTGPSRCRDTELMADALRALGIAVSTVDDGRWVIRPRPLRGPARVEAGHAGTVMRFLPPLAALAIGTVTFDGDASARNRPLGQLVAALRTLGARVDGTDLPIAVHGTGAIRGGDVTIDASASSQLISGLLLAASDFDRGIRVRHEGPPVPRAPHLRMTVEMLRAAGAGVDEPAPDVWTVQPGQLNGRGWDIEPDLAAAAPFFAAALVTGGRVHIPRWPRTTTQAGDQLRALLTRMGGTATRGPYGMTLSGDGKIHGVDVDLSAAGELTTVIAALATMADSPSRLRGIGHVRGHETDRLACLRRELSALGTVVSELPDGLLIEPRPLTGGVFETYGDHRMAHAAAVIGLVVPGITLTDVACTAKTMPDFPRQWSKMVAGTWGYPPPLTEGNH